ncbi:hypothetical protein JCM11641_004179 [Rhodosporidiobolus odoratus]
MPFDKRNGEQMEFYTFNSTYALFPFTTPHITGEILKNLQIAERYNASRPVAVPDWAILTSHKAAKEVFNDQKTYKNMYGAHLKALQDRYPEPAFLSHFEAFDTPARRGEAKGALEAALFPPHWAQLLLAQVGEATKQQISQQGWAYEKGGRMRLDVVNDLVVPVAMNYLAETLGLPMKTDDKYSFGLFATQSPPSRKHCSFFPSSSLGKGTVQLSSCLILSLLTCTHASFSSSASAHKAYCDFSSVSFTACAPVILRLRPDSLLLSPPHSHPLHSLPHSPTFPLLSPCPSPSPSPPISASLLRPSQAPSPLQGSFPRSSTRWRPRAGSTAANHDRGDTGKMRDFY